MNRTELVEAIAEDTGFSRTMISQVLTSMFSNIINALKKQNGKVAITGFCTFEKRRRKARTGRNPKTGEKIKIPARNTVLIRVNKKLREAIR